MHTGGEPVRIVTSGYPPLFGATLLEKRRDARDRHDALRCLLMFEPRGHADMYGAVLVEPDHPEADLAVLFLHNEGYSTMCGHAVIALGRWAVDSGLVAAQEPDTAVNIQCPCGLVRTLVSVENGRAGRVRFRSVPAFAFARQVMVDTRDWGPLEIDIAYGGAFYALLSADSIGLEVAASSVRALSDAGEAITAAAAEISLAHPDDPDLAFLYGTIFTDGRDAYEADASRNVCVFAGRQVDRSPTGSGVTARVALQWTRGEIALGQTRTFESVTGACFTATAVEETTVGHHRAVVVEVAGKAHYSGEARFTLEPDDPLGEGFLLG
ncbi:proline racemase family protein [Pelagibius litoralis]|uniref:Proline racemase family protein n=2 Tax=Pelagibius litoralis TaxID=374515 RepID=A0A967F0Q4_9PROT|nr:proline racemase family protein [Pelagibius litoralis]